MFGITSTINLDGKRVTLRPFEKEEIANKQVAAAFSQAAIHTYTATFRGNSIADEAEWYERVRSDKSTTIWGIQPHAEDFKYAGDFEKDSIIGVTSIHNAGNGKASTGIVIFDPRFHRQGIGYRAHLLRLLYINDWPLGISRIFTVVRTKNIASKKALEKVGYGVWGVKPFDTEREGQFLSSTQLMQIIPKYKGYLFPNGVDDEFWKERIGATERALKIARKHLVK